MNTRVVPDHAFDTSRNWGFIDAKAQIALGGTAVAIAGVGGVGGRIAIELTRLGVGHLILADPDIFTSTNLNRQEGSYISTINSNKAQTISNICKDINPRLKIDLYKSGINENNLDDFMSSAGIVVEATDYALPHLGVMLARAARARDIPLIVGIEMGFGATLTWFPPDGFTYERHLGLKSDVSISDLKDGSVNVDIGRWITHIPAYAQLEVFKKVMRGEKEAPAVSPAVGLCSAMAVTQILAIVTGANTTPPAPAVYSVDVKEHKSRIIRHPALHYRISLFRMLLRSMAKPAA